MQRIPFGQRLVVTSTGGALGLVALLVGIAVDGSVETNAEAVAIFAAVAGATAVVGAALTRRWATAMLAALVAAASPLAVIVVVVASFCGAGYCE